MIIFSDFQKSQTIEDVYIPITYLHSSADFMKNEMLITHIDGVEVEISVISETPFIVFTTSTLRSLYVLL